MSTVALEICASYSTFETRCYGWQAIKCKGGPEHCSLNMWHYTYIIENPKGYQYVGITDDLDDRLERHNRGEIPSTAKYRPWQLMNFTAFPIREQAAAYEKYLKSGSGTTFRQRHLVPKKYNQ